MNKSYNRSQDWVQTKGCMTDREILVEMLTKRGIVFSEEEPVNHGNPKPISIESGYAGLVSWFIFEEDGSLQSVSAWE